MSARRRGLRFTVAAATWLTVLWVLLWGDLTAANVLAGVTVALAVGLTLRMPPVHYAGRIHVVSLLYLLWRFVLDLVIASAQVVRLALSPGGHPEAALIGVQLRSRNELYMTLTSVITSLIPGSVVVEAHRTTGMLYVHVLHVPMAHGVEAARTHVLDTEARVLRALGSDAELEAAGLPRKPGGTAGGPVGGGRTEARA